MEEFASSELEGLPELGTVLGGKYRLERVLGMGGMGAVVLAEHEQLGERVAIKFLLGKASQDPDRVKRFSREAWAAAKIKSDHVVRVLDIAAMDDGTPYLVLEYLIGADLKQYSVARRMTLFELRRVVLESCAGLAALHNAGLVHRDIKPANIWLRLPLAGGVRFDPEKHRDPAVTPPLTTVVIDFGMVRAVRVPAESGGRFVAGTAGYIAPEQVLDPVELDPRADVYALAATIYNVTTGRAFFDEIENYRDRIIAHMRRDPFEDAERLKIYPATVAKLLRAATAKKPTHRPTPMEFGKAFAEAL